MKVESTTKAFQPITITLETEEDMYALIQIIRASHRETSPYVAEIGDLLYEGIVQAYDDDIDPPDAFRNKRDDR